jgi:hypothetical protein
MPIRVTVRNRKPKLASGQRVVVDVNGVGTPGLGSQSGVVSTGEKKEALPRRALRSVIGFAILGLLMLFLTYVVLATTVFVLMRADNHNAAVLRNTFPIGQAPADVLVYASSAPVDNTLMGKAEQAIFGVPAGSVVQIVAGPSATVSTNKSGHIVVDGTPTNYVGEVDSQDLSRQYIAICVSGACKDGAAVMVEQDNIIGEVKGYLGLSGMTKPKV